MSNEKIQSTISKLESSNGALGVKIAVNKSRIRALIGKLAGVKPGDVVVLKGVRYKVHGIESETVPARGKPVLTGFKLAKNGNAGKRPVEIKGAWTPETAAVAAAPRRRGRPPKAAAAPVATAPRRRGRPSKASLQAAQVAGTA